MDVFVGVDGGGTKTRAQVVTADGQLLADLLVAGCNVNHHGWLETERRLSDLFAAIRSAVPAGGRVAAIALGLAGVDREAERTRMLAFVTAEWPGAEVRVENDAVLALAADGGDGVGIVLIGGTGSIAYGKNLAGRTARVGGWGYGIGDEGSGYDIGRRALQAVMKAYDGRRPPTALTQHVLAHLGVAEPSALIPIVYDSQFTRQQMASVTQCVFAAAQEGDFTSQQLLDAAAAELSELVLTLKQQLFAGVATVTVVTAGGLFHPGSAVGEAIRQQLEPRGCRVLAASAPPVAGAVRLARQAAAELDKS